MRRSLGTLLLLTAMVYPTIGAWLYFVRFAGHEWMDLLYYGSKVVQVGLPLLGWFVIGLPARYGPPQPGRGLGLGLVTGIVMSGAIFGAYALFTEFGWLSISPDAISARLEAFGAVSVAGYTAIALGISLVHSLFEEYYWRWFVFGELRRRLHIVAAVTLSSLAFASHHVIVIDRFVGSDRFWTLTVPFAVAVAFGGAVWAWLFHRHRSLLGAWLSHLLVDAAIMTIGYRIVWG